MDSKTNDNMNKKRRMMIGGVVVVALILVFLLVFFLYLKPTFESGILEYSSAYEDFSAAKQIIVDENNDLSALIDALQNLTLSDDKPYDPETITNANSAINEGKIALGKSPDLESYVVKAPDQYGILQALSLKKDISDVLNYTEELRDVYKKDLAPAYAAAHNQIEEATDALDRSIRQLKQVTRPSEAFILERVTNIRDSAGMIDIIALTEDTDTDNHIGKSGWYYSKVIFQHKDVDHYGLSSGLLTLAEVGNPAGGCVEAYNSVEDAQKRDEYLKSIEGTIRSPGAHVVVGTLVVRVTEDIKTSTQKKILNMLIDELLRLD